MLSAHLLELLPFRSKFCIACANACCRRNVWILHGSSAGCADSTEFALPPRILGVPCTTKLPLAWAPNTCLSENLMDVYQGENPAVRAINRVQTGYGAIFSAGGAIRVPLAGDVPRLFVEDCNRPNNLHKLTCIPAMNVPIILFNFSVSSTALEFRICPLPLFRHISLCYLRCAYTHMCASFLSSVHTPVINVHICRSV